MSIYYGINQYTGQYFGSGGSSVMEHGGPGTFYLEKVIINASAPFKPNRTIYINNENKYPQNPGLDLRSTYTDMKQAPSVGWLTLSDTYEDRNVVIDELQIFGGARLAFVNPALPRSRVNLTLGNLKGDRTGKLHVGFNQSMLSLESPLLMDLAVYPGGTASLQGTLLVSGVRLVLDGVLENCESITVKENGVVEMKDMIDISGQPTRVCIFTCNIRPIVFLFRNDSCGVKLSKHRYVKPIQF